jgi:hypothetical protein
VSPDGFYDSQEKVYQRFLVPFANWTDLNAQVRSRARVISNLSCDEMLMPNRSGDWYDDGFIWCIIITSLHRVPTVTGDIAGIRSRRL